MSVKTVYRKAPERANNWARTKIRVKRYEIGGAIGEGGFSKVYLAKTSRFLLGEDANERACGRVSILRAGMTRQRRSKSRTARILRPPGTKVPLPELVAIKVMKVQVPDERELVVDQQEFYEFGKMDPKRKTDLRSPELAQKLERAASKVNLAMRKQKDLPESRIESNVVEIKIDEHEEPCASRLVNANQESKHIRRRNSKGPAARKAKEILNEIECMRRVRPCKFCVYLHDVVQLEREVWIVMDYSHLNNLQTFRRRVFRKEPPSCSLIRWWIAPIMLALNYMHERGMIHRDVKGANILLTRQGVPKLCDFGLVHRFETLPVAAEEFAGTPVFAPPEVFINLKETLAEKERDDACEDCVDGAKCEVCSRVQESQMIDTSFDTWSIGITMLSLLFGGSPWDYQPTVILADGRVKKYRQPKFRDHKLKQFLGNLLPNYVRMHGYKMLHRELYMLDRDEVVNDEELLRLRVKSNRKIPPQELEQFDEDKKEFMNFVKKCLKLRKHRPTIGELLDDPYMKTTVREWEKFDAFKENEMKYMSEHGLNVKRLVKNEEKTEFRKRMEEMALLSFASFRPAGK